MWRARSFGPSADAPATVQGHPAVHLAGGSAQQYRHPVSQLSVRAARPGLHLQGVHHHGHRRGHRRRPRARASAAARCRCRSRRTSSPSSTRWSPPREPSTRSTPSSTTDRPPHRVQHRLHRGCSGSSTSTAWTPPSRSCFAAAAVWPARSVPRSGTTVFGAGTIVARNPDTGQALADRLGYDYAPEVGSRTAPVIVNVTPIGMAGGPDEEQSAFDDATIAKAHTVFDVVALPVGDAADRGRPRGGGQGDHRRRSDRTAGRRAVRTLYRRATDGRAGGGGVGDLAGVTRQGVIVVCSSMAAVASISGPIWSSRPSALSCST